MTAQTFTDWVASALTALRERVIANRNRLPAGFADRYCAIIDSAGTGKAAIPRIQQAKGLDLLDPGLQAIKQGNLAAFQDAVSNRIVLNKVSGAVLTHELVHTIGGNEIDAEMAEQILAPETYTPPTADDLEEFAALREGVYFKGDWKGSLPSEVDQRFDPYQPGLRSLKDVPTEDAPFSLSFMRTLKFDGWEMAAGAYPVMIGGPFGPIFSLYIDNSQSSKAVYLYPQGGSLYDAIRVAGGKIRRAEQFTPVLNGQRVGRLDLVLYMPESDSGKYVYIDLE